MSNYVFLDLETQQSFDDVGGHYPEDMTMSLAVTYDYKSLYRHWDEDDIASLLEYLNQFNFIIGYNLIDFDYKVLGHYQETDSEVIQELENKTIDILNLIEAEIGTRISLDDIAKATLNKKKSGNGLKAIEFWRNGEIEKLKRYCENDVKLTVAIFEFIQKNQCLYYTSYGLKNEISISLPEAARIVELNIEVFKAELNAYFEVLFAGENVSKNQIKLLKEKTDKLIDFFENSASDNEESNYDKEVTYGQPIGGQLTSNSANDEKKDIFLHKFQPPPSAPDITEPVDDLPF